MDKKVYQVINKFVQHLSDAEDMWRTSPGNTDKFVETLKAVLVKNGFGKSDEELVKTLLMLASSIVTKPEADENYPAINFMHGKAD